MDEEATFPKGGPWGGGPFARSSERHASDDNCPGRSRTDSADESRKRPRRRGDRPPNDGGSCRSKEVFPTKGEKASPPPSSATSSHPPHGVGHAVRASCSEDGVSVSIVVLTHNRAPLLGDLLESIRRLDWDPALLEVCVVGDADIHDETEAVVRRFAASVAFPVQYLLAPNNLAAKRNAGVRATVGEIIAFTDDDCRVAPDWLRHGCRALADGSLAGVQGQTKVPAAEGDGAFHHVTRQLAVPNYQTCNILYRREALLGAGGFDERFSFIHEDADLAFTVLEQGGEIGYCPEAVVYHPPRADHGLNPLHAARRSYLAPLLCKKHPGLYRRCHGSLLSRSTRAYLALDGIALLFFTLGIGPAALAAGGARLLLLAAQVRRHCRGVRSFLRVAVTTFSLLLAPYASLYYLAAGTLRFGGKAWPDARSSLCSRSAGHRSPLGGLPPGGRADPVPPSTEQRAPGHLASDEVWSARRAPRGTESAAGAGDPDQKR